MNQKAKRIKLSPTEYKKLKLLILKRDRWRCRVCGNRNDLHVHHIKYRSNSGDDTATNLLTLCRTHHELIHQNKLRIVQGEAKVIDGNKEIRFEKVI